MNLNVCCWIRIEITRLTTTSLDQSAVIIFAQHFKIFNSTVSYLRSVVLYELWRFMDGECHFFIHSHFREIDDNITYHPRGLCSCTHIWRRKRYATIVIMDAIFSFFSFFLFNKVDLKPLFGISLKLIYHNTS